MGDKKWPTLSPTRPACALEHVAKLRSVFESVFDFVRKTAADDSKFPKGISNLISRGVLQGIEEGVAKGCCQPFASGADKDSFRRLRLMLASIKKEAAHIASNRIPMRLFNVLYESYVELDDKLADLPTLSDEHREPTPANESEIELGMTTVGPNPQSISDPDQGEVLHRSDGSQMEVEDTEIDDAEDIMRKYKQIEDHAALLRHELIDFESDSEAEDEYGGQEQEKQGKAGISNVESDEGSDSDANDTESEVENDEDRDEDEDEDEEEDEEDGEAAAAVHDDGVGSDPVRRLAQRAESIHLEIRGGLDDAEGRDYDVRDSVKPEEGLDELNMNDASTTEPSREITANDQPRPLDVFFTILRQTTVNKLETMASWQIADQLSDSLHKATIKEQTWRRAVQLSRAKLLDNGHLEFEALAAGLKSALSLEDLANWIKLSSMQ